MINYFTESNAFIKQALEQSETNRVLVHCAAGVSRSGAFCAAYMIGEGKLTFAQAMELGQSKRKGLGFHPNTNFQSQLRSYENTLRKKASIDTTHTNIDLTTAGFVSAQ